MRLEHHLVGGYVRYISPYIIIIIIINIDFHCMAKILFYMALVRRSDHSGGDFVVTVGGEKAR